MFAASSLAEAFSAVKDSFEAVHPDLSVTLNFAASSQLVIQLDQGARADVFASADQFQMDRARAANLIEGADHVFATNRLVVITPRNNPGNVERIEDLGRPGLKLVTSQDEVPIGAYTRAALEKMSGDAAFGLDFAQRAAANVVSREANVRQIVVKVQLGEADAAIVYATDVTPAATNRLRTVPIPAEFNTVVSYPVAAVRNPPNPSHGREFIDYLLSVDGRRILAEWGFGPPASL